MSCSPGVSLGFSNVTKNVSKRIGYDPSELRNSSHSLHGEGLSSAGLSVSKYGSWEQNKDRVHILHVYFMYEVSIHTDLFINYSKELTQEMCFLYECRI